VLPAAIVSANPSEKFRPEPSFIVSGLSAVSTNWPNFSPSHPLQTLHPADIPTIESFERIATAGLIFRDPIVDKRTDCFCDAMD
jgi:hypothetical protein